jgi:hypothetical protein
MDDEDGHHLQQQTNQVAGENTLSPRIVKGGLSNNPSLKELEDRYVKTSSMAHFYYRKTGGSVENFLMRHSKSHGQIAKEAAAAMPSSGSSQSGLAARHERKRSKSAVDLGKTISSISGLPPLPS